MRPRFLDRIGIDDCFAAFLLALSVLVGCEIPTPQPPGPNPPPVVVTDSTVIVIEETAERTPDTATVLGDVAFWSSLGVKWRIYDDDSPDSVVYLPLVNDRPGMVVLDKGGRKVWSGPLPKTTDGVKRLLK